MSLMQRDLFRIATALVHDVNQLNQYEVCFYSIFLFSLIAARFLG